MTNRFMTLVRLLVVIAWMVILSGAGWAQQPGNLKVLEDQFAAHQQTLEQIKTDLANTPLAGERLSEIESRLRTLRTALLDIANQVESAWTLNKKALEQLGPAPDKPSEPEPESIASERERLSEQQTRLDNLLRGSETFAARAFALINAVTDRRREGFFDELLSRQRLPISGFLWKQAASAIVEGLGKTATFVSAWYDARVEDGSLARASALLGVGLALAVALFAFGRTQMQIFIDNVHAREKPGRRTVIALVGFAVVANVVLAGISLEVLLISLSTEGLIDAASMPLARRVAVAAMIMVFAVTVRLRVVKWGLDLPGIPPASVLAKPLGSFAFVVIAAIFGIDLVLIGGADLIDAGLYFTFVQSFMTAMTMAAMLLLIAWLGRKPHPDDPEATLMPRWVLLSLAAVAAVTVFSELLGFLAFGRYLIRTGVVFCVLVVLFALFRRMARELFQRIERRFTTMRDEEGSPHLVFAFWGGIVADVILAILAAVVILKQVRFGPREIQDWLSLGLQGFKIGNVTISLTDLFTAVALFAVLIVITRFSQRTLERDILPQTRFDSGVANSLVRFVGYVGVILAGLVAIGAAGVDLSNLAIIAGALSVGIGFGLQSIVNNFVSGLILLFERPVKVGDWIVADSGEGTVRKIGVRSTIIETFERSHLIIPNSELMSSPVRNWTYSNRIARVVIPVGVSYDSDPRRVYELLLESSGAHPGILKDPAPYVLFNGFGDSSLDFELRVYIRDVNDILVVPTVLRFDIWTRLKDAGIEIPFPQTDLNIKEIDRLESALSGRAATRSEDIGSTAGPRKETLDRARGEGSSEGDAE